MAVLNLPAPETEFEARRQLARVPITQPPGAFGALLGWTAKKLYGRTLDNGFALAPHKRALFAMLMFERRVAKFHSLDDTLKALAVMAVSVEIGCSWCVDFGYHEANGKGVDLVKLEQIASWRDSDVYTDTERRVIEYAQAATATPPQVTDELVDALRADLGDKAFIELTVMIAIENERSRINAALGLVSQGFSASCQLPSATRPR